MKDLTNSFGHLFHPVKALLIYQKDAYGHNNEFYIESFDMDNQGCPTNAHPLSVKEANKLARSLQVNEKKARGFLNPKGLMPVNVLYLKSSADGFAVWHTPPQNIKLLFIERLGIPSGLVNLPALVWRAGKNSLQVFAVAKTTYQEDTPLCHAPFFNIYADGRVCMGNVQIRIPKDCGLEEFMVLWQDYFFNSYFSHLFGQHVPIKGNIVQFWQNLINSKEAFPIDCLIPNHISITKLLP